MHSMRKGADDALLKSPIVIATRLVAAKDESCSGTEFCAYIGRPAATRRAKFSRARRAFPSPPRASPLVGQALCAQDNKKEQERLIDSYLGHYSARQLIFKQCGNPDWTLLQPTLGSGYDIALTCSLRRRLSPTR